MEDKMKILPAFERSHAGSFREHNLSLRNVGLKTPKRGQCQPPLRPMVSANLPAFEATAFVSACFSDLWFPVSGKGPGHSSKSFI